MSNRKANINKCGDSREVFRSPISIVNNWSAQMAYAAGCAAIEFLAHDHVSRVLRGWQRSVPISVRGKDFAQIEVYSNI